MLESERNLDYMCETDTRHGDGSRYFSSRLCRMFKGFIFDLGLGTVYVSDQLIPDADRVIQLIREKGRKVVFLSNKPIQTREDYASKLTRLGIPTQADEVINSTFVMTNYLKKIAPQARLFVIGEPPFIEELKRSGFFKSPMCQRKIDYVVVAFDRAFDYGKIEYCFPGHQIGGPFCSNQPDRTCPVGRWRNP